MPKVRSRPATPSSHTARDATSPYARPSTTRNATSPPVSPSAQQQPPRAIPADTLCFFSGSKHVPPGQGSGEFVRDPSLYMSLAHIPHWRRVLSNFDSTTAFAWRNRQWASIEHAFQGAKMGLVNPLAMAAFALDSTPQDRGSFAHIGSQPALVARNSRKLIVLPPAKVREWSATSARIMEDIARAKYSACEVGKQVLEATREAQLWHAGPRIAAVRFVHLERIREEMRENNDRHPAVGTVASDADSDQERERKAAGLLGDALFEHIDSEDEDGTNP